MAVMLTRKHIEHSYAAVASFVTRVGQTQLERAAAGTDKNSGCPSGESGCRDSALARRDRACQSTWAVGPGHGRRDRGGDPLAGRARRKRGPGLDPGCLSRTAGGALSRLEARLDSPCRRHRGTLLSSLHGTVRRSDVPKLAGPVRGHSVYRDGAWRRLVRRSTALPGG